MIRYRVVLKADAFEDAEAWVRFVGDDVYALSKDILDKMRPKMMDELMHYPPRVKYPIQWTSVKQRRAFFASNGFGAGIPYKRTRALARGWNAQIHRKSDNASTLEIWNAQPYARFVVGTLSGNPQRAMRPMQRFHVNTGWQPAGQTVQFWVQAYEEEFKRRFANEAIPAATNPQTRRYAITPRQGRR